ncbi:unnamed protein product [Ectocarpus sp. 6 AP-2014]
MHPADRGGDLHPTVPRLTADGCFLNALLPVKQLDRQCSEETTRDSYSNPKVLTRFTRSYSAS